MNLADHLRQRSRPLLPSMPLETVQTSMSRFAVRAAGAEPSPEVRDMRERMISGFERAKRERAPMVFLAIAIERMNGLRRRFGEGVVQEILFSLEDLASRSAGNRELLGVYEEETLLVLIGDTPVDRGNKLAQGLLDAAASLSLTGSDQPVRVKLSIGMANNQRRGDLAWDTVSRVAAEGLAVARAAGGGRVVHTELYQLFQSECGPAAAEDRIASVPATPEAPRSTASAPAVEEEEAREDERSREEQEAELSQALADLRGHLTTSHEEQMGRQTRELEILRRRVAKLTNLLGLTETQLRRVLVMKGVDPGVASVYKEVQGLDSADPLFNARLKLMTSIFESNVALRFAAAHGRD